MRLDWNVFFALALVCVVWTKACSIVSSSSHEIGNYRASVRSDSLAERDGFELAVPLVPHEKGRFLRNERCVLCPSEKGAGRHRVNSAIIARSTSTPPMRRHFGRSLR